MSERLAFRAEDGTRLSARWDAPERPGDAGVLLLPGWWRRADSPRLRELALSLSRRWPVLTLDFRGHGESGGLFTFGRLEHLDAEAALREMARRGLRRAAIVGLSMGGACTIVTIGREGGLPLAIGGAVTVSAPSHFGLIRPAPWRGRRDVPWGDAWRLPRTEPWSPLRDKLVPADHVARVGVPLRLVHGRSDWLVDHAHGLRLHEASGGRAELLVVDEHGAHADELLARVPGLMLRLLRPFLASALQDRAGDAAGEGEEVDPGPWAGALRDLVADPSRHSPDLGDEPLRGELDAVRAFASRDGVHLALRVGGEPAWARGLRDGTAHGLASLPTQLVTDGVAWSEPLRRALRGALGGGSTAWTLRRRGRAGFQAEPRILP